MLRVLDLGETLVYDSIAHAYDMAPTSYRNERHAEGSVGVLAGNTDTGPAEYHLSQEGFMRGWGVEETANTLFRESRADMATVHTVPMYVFHDGLVANERAAGVVGRCPDRFRSYAAVDPLRAGWEGRVDVDGSGVTVSLRLTSPFCTQIPYSRRARGGSANPRATHTG